jgi:hypothetical protein
MPNEHGLLKRDRNNTENEGDKIGHHRNLNTPSNLLTNASNTKMISGLKKSESQILLGKFSSLINNTSRLSNNGGAKGHAHSPSNSENASASKLSAFKSYKEPGQPHHNK